MKNLIISKLTFLSILSVIITFSFCKKDDDSLSNDNLIKNKLIGTWYIYNYKTISFKTNNTFIDTSYALYNDKPNEYQITNILQGSYSIDNGQLKFSDIKLIYTKGQENVTLGSYYTELEPLNNLSFDNDKLVIEPKTSLSTELKTNSIIGKWSSDELIAVYDKNLENKFTGGIKRSTFNFKSDSSVVCEYKFIYDNKVFSANDSVDFNFKSSVLSINQWNFSVNVSFNDNQMFWIHSKEIYQKK